MALQEVPYTMLSPEALRGVIEEYVSREGTDYGLSLYSLAEKVEHVMRQLRRGEVVITWDTETETVNLLIAKDARRQAAAAEEEGE